MTSSSSSSRPGPSGRDAGTTLIELLATIALIMVAVVALMACALAVMELSARGNDAAELQARLVSTTEQMGSLPVYGTANRFKNYQYANQATLCDPSNSGDWAKNWTEGDYKFSLKPVRWAKVYTKGLSTTQYQWQKIDTASISTDCIRADVYELELQVANGPGQEKKIRVVRPWAL